jgi:hypothetical protein
MSAFEGETDIKTKLLTRDESANDRGEHRKAAGAVAKAVVRQLEFKRRARLRRPSSLRLTRPLRGEISQRFRYLRDLPPASSEYRPQSARRAMKPITFGFGQPPG